MGRFTLAALALGCATPATTQRPPEAQPAAVDANPIPPPSDKKAVIVPSDVKLGPGAAGPGTAGPPTPAASPTLGATPGN